MTNDLDEDKILYHLRDWNMGLHEHSRVTCADIYFILGDLLRYDSFCSSEEPSLTPEPIETLGISSSRRKGRSKKQVSQRST